MNLQLIIHPIDCISHKYRRLPKSFSPTLKFAISYGKSYSRPKQYFKGCTISLWDEKEIGNDILIAIIKNGEIETFNEPTT